MIGTALGDQTKHLEDQLEKIRERYLIPLKGFMPVIMGELRQAFDAEMDAFRKDVHAKREQMKLRVEAELKGSRARLKGLLIDSYSKKAPERPQMVQLCDDLRRKAIETLVEEFLKKAYPSADRLVTSMEVDWSIFNVSEQIIEKPKFREAVRQAFGVDVEDLVRTEQAIGLRPADPYDGAPI